MNIKNMQTIIEALLFVSGDPLPIERISEILELDKKAVKLLLDNMMIEFENSNRGVIIREINGAYQLHTRPECFEYIKRLVEPRQKQSLSQAAFEVLAIIAYNQPVTKAKINSIRGVNSESAIEKLIERGLIQEAGKLDCPGKPILYATTDEFLRCFGFKSIADLPIIDLKPEQENSENIQENNENI